MNRKILIILSTVLLCAIIFVIYSQIQPPSDGDADENYSIYQLSLDDDKVVMSDGGGPYEVPESAFVAFVPPSSPDSIVFQMSQPGTIYSARNITVRFSDAQWKSLSLMDILPKHATESYYINAYFFFSGKLADVNVGDRVNIPEISIDLVDVNNRSNYIWTIGRCDNATVPLVYVPPQLYDEGHVELIRESNDVWIIDVDAWFIAHYADVQGNYIRLSFIMTITFREG